MANWMFTYQLQARRLVITQGTAPTFPCRVQLSMSLAPPEPFGASHGYSLTTTRGSKTHAILDKNHGRTVFKSDLPLDPLDISFLSAGTQWGVKANQLSRMVDVRSEQELAAALYLFQLSVPALLNLHFVDAPTYSSIVVIGESFRGTWEIDAIEARFSPSTTGEQQDKLMKAVSFAHLCEQANYLGFIAGIAYFHRACRLLRVGSSPSEFLAEATLNMSKCLEALFPGARDQSMVAIRLGLSKLGLSDKDIRSHFDPIILLRNSLDVGHVKLHPPSNDDLKDIYKFLSRSEDRLRKLLLMISERVLAGNCPCSFERPADNGGEQKKKRDKHRKLMQSIRASTTNSDTVKMVRIDNAALKPWNRSKP